VVLLVNPAAGGGRARRVLDVVEDRLRRRGLPHRTHHTRSIADVAVAVATALDADETPVAVGGDGMIRLVADAVSHRPGATIGIVPAGRGNDLVRFLGLPRDPVAAADALVDGTPWAIDTGAVRGDDGGEQTFLSIASCGFDSEANRIANRAPKRLGGLTYVWGMLGALARLRNVRYALDLDDRAVVHHGLTVAIANAGTYGGGMRLAPDASVSDGRLDVVLLRRHRGGPGPTSIVDRARLVRRLPDLFRGTHVRLADVDVERAETVRVDADERFEVYADGDLVGRLPVTIAVRPRALRLLVPVGHRTPSGDGPHRLPRPEGVIGAGERAR